MAGVAASALEESEWKLTSEIMPSSPSTSAVQLSTQSQLF
jgi:hypothetical protein